MEALPLEIGIFLNSGHHYHFAPLPEAFLKANPEVEETCRKETDWQGWPGKKWIRYRYGTKSEICGVWLAVESNLGGKKRGFPWEPKKAIPPQPVPPNFDPNETPYAYPSSNYLPEVTEVLRLAGGLQPPIDLAKITWKRPVVDHPRDVDLVVDFGNTRTVALLLEQHTPTRNLSDICHPVRFQQRAEDYEPSLQGHPADDPCVIVDSWLMLHETVFAQLEPPSPKFSAEVLEEVEEREVGWGPFKTREKQIVAKTGYIPQMFVELSPALLGGGAGRHCARAVLRDHVRLDEGGNYFLSSPKRYAWDNDRVGHGGKDVFWCMALNPWNDGFGKAATTKLPHLQGQILRFMPGDGRRWTMESPPIALPSAQAPHANDDPTHPRSCTLTWVALAILERAYAQITSQAYQKMLASPFVPRRLRSVLVTFPAGWTSAELECYRAKWQEAIDIFTLGHLQDHRPTAEGGHWPKLITDLDEAVASQLPMIYSEVLRMPDGESWIELVGRGSGNHAHVRTMNIDIGGGTTDIAIVDYVDKLPGIAVALEATTLFKNSSTVAGDALVKRIIETTLLPKLGERFAAATTERDKFNQFFGDPPAQFLVKVPAFRRRLARVVRLVFIPIVNAWLNEVSGDRYGDPEKAWQGYAPCDMRTEDGAQTVDEKIVDELNGLAREFLGSNVDILPWNEAINYDQTVVKQCVQDEFLPLFHSLAKLVAAFDCDLVFVSGKPSELPQVYDLLRRELPLLPQRIISAKNFPEGGWYPLGAGDGKIHDAKTVTAVGAALYQAMQSGHIVGWNIMCKTDTSMFSENAWGDCTIPALFDANVFLRSGETEVTRDMLLGTRIGRKRFGSRDLLPDHVYRLRWKEPDKHPLQTPVLAVTLRREKQDGAAESLTLVSVQAVSGSKVSMDDVELQICSLPGDGFWMDSPCFNIQYPP
jgi:hypothetical protein